ncbi:hypothetical protein HaLaN_12045, partial [Haematococcus lacustris]
MPKYLNSLTTLLGAAVCELPLKTITFDLPTLNVRCFLFSAGRPAAAARATRYVVIGLFEVNEGSEKLAVLGICAGLLSVDKIAENEHGLHGAASREEPKLLSWQHF